LVDSFGYTGLYKRLIVQETKIGDIDEVFILHG